MLVHRQLDLKSAALSVAIAVLIRDLGVGAVSMPATNMGMAGLPVEISSHASAANSWLRQCAVALAIGLINTFITMRTELHLSANAYITDATLQYDTSFVMAMHDLFSIILLVTLFGIFAVSRMHYSR